MMTSVQQLVNPNSNSVVQLLIINSPLTMCNACHMGYASVNLPPWVLERGKDKALTDTMVQKRIMII